MTYTPTIYTWPTACEPIDQMFRAGGQAIQGGMMLGGAMAQNPEPGGVAELSLSFAAFVTPQANLEASWLMSRITNGAIMRVKLWNTVQLVPWADLDIADTGQTWLDGGAWENGSYWQASPYAPVTAAASKGAETVIVDCSIPGRVLSRGHVIGFTVGDYDFAHLIMAVSYDGDDRATLTIAPPLRRALTTSNRLFYWPSMLVTCRNAAEVAGQFRRGLHVQLNGARLVEALV